LIIFWPKIVYPENVKVRFLYILPIKSNTLNQDLEEEQLKLKSIKYLDKKGILKDKINKRYYRDNDLAKHLKVDQKQ